MHAVGVRGAFISCLVIEGTEERDAGDKVSGVCCRVSVRDEERWAAGCGMRYAGARCWGLVSESLGGRFGKAVRTAQDAWRLSSRWWSHCPVLVSWMVDGRAGTVCSVCAVC